MVLKDINSNTDPVFHGIPVNFGRQGHYKGYRYFNGTIDEVAIYDRALTAEQIQQHYQNGLNGLGYELPPTPTPPPAVGGILEIQTGGSRSTADSAADSSSGSPLPYYITLATGVAAGVIVLGTGGWYARRRWLARR